MSRGATRQRHVYGDRKAAGLCAACGKGPPVDERSQCFNCLAKLRTRAKKRTAERKSLGQCVQCGLPCAEGIAHCRECRPLKERTLKARSAAQERRRAAEEKQKHTRELIREHLHILTARQRAVMTLRVGTKGESVRSGPEVAAILNVSRQAVWAVEAAAWRRINRAREREASAAIDTLRNTPAFFRQEARRAPSETIKGDVSQRISNYAPKAG